MQLQFKITGDAAQARRFGWTKNHRLLSVFTVGAWRPMGFYTPKQIERGAWKADATAKLHTNGGAPKGEPVEFIPCA